MDGGRRDVVYGLSSIVQLGIAPPCRHQRRKKMTGYGRASGNKWERRPWTRMARQAVGLLDGR
jgi:hypothetical protein